jgi:hypothetical protein
LKITQKRDSGVIFGNLYLLKIKLLQTTNGAVYRPIKLRASKQRDKKKYTSTATSSIP